MSRATGPVVALVATAAAATAAWWIWSARDADRDGVIDGPVRPDDVVWRDRLQYVVDATTGHKPRASFTKRFHIAPLGGKKRQIEKRQNDHGFHRRDDLGYRIPRPRVLMLGDSHIDGVVSVEDNASTLLESELDGAVVLNAGCGFYSLYQYVLRASTLIPRYEIDVVVIVAFMGNDFLDLEDQTRPHLDDQGSHADPNPDAPRERTSGRLRKLGLAKSEIGSDKLFWQGMNQAAFLHLQPERGPVVRTKAARCIDRMAELADEHGTDVLWVLLPSFDLVFPDVAAATPFAGEVVESGAQQQLHDWFAGELERQGALAVDLLPVYRKIARQELYATDYHIFVEGHRALATAIREPVATLLRNR